MIDRQFYRDIWTLVGALLTGAIAAALPTFTDPTHRVIAAIVGIAVGGTIGALGGAYVRRKRPPAKPYAPGPGDLDFSPAHLLIAHRQVVEYMEFGQLEEMLGDFSKWALDGVDKVRIVTGTGGVGKTRFAVELSRRVGERGLRTWFVPRGAEGQFVEHHVPSGSGGLLVVDYAEGRPALDDLLAGVARRDHWRVLLLARSVGDWAEPLGRRDDAYRMLDTARRTARTLGSPARSDHAALAMAAALSFADALGRDAPTEVNVSQAFSSATVLEIHAAVLLAMLDEEVVASKLVVDLHDVYRQLLRHEANHWITVAHAVGMPTEVGMSAMLDVAAAHALFGVEASEEMTTVFQVLEGDKNNDVLWRAWVNGLYPRDSLAPERIAAIAPDKLAEFLITEQFHPDHPGFRRVLTASTAGQMLNALLVLARASGDGFAGADKLLIAVVHGAAERLPRLDAPVDLLEVIDAVLPDIQMSESVASLGLNIVGDSLEKSTPSAPVTARLMGRYASRASAVGETVLALKYADQAVRTFRFLAESKPAQYRPALATALNNLAIRLDQDGTDAPGALRAGLEALAIREELAAGDARYRPALVQSLSTLAIRLSDAGQYTEALELAARSVKLHHEIGSDADEPSPGLARTLANLAQHLARLRRVDEGLKAAKEAIALYEILSERNPVQYGFELSSAYMTEAQLYFLADEVDDALRSSERAVAIREDFASENPDRFAPDLVRAMNNHAVFQYRGGLPEAAVVTAERAFAITAMWTGDLSGRQLRAAAELSNTLANAYTQDGRPRKAIEAGTQAIELLRKQDADHPGEYEISLARALHNQARRMQRADQPCAAIPLCEEAVRIRSHLAKMDPDAHMRSLQSSAAVRAELMNQCNEKQTEGSDQRSETL